MADPFVFNDLAGTAITGTASTSLLATTATIPTGSMADAGTEFVGLFSAIYHNDTGARHDINLDLMANGNLVHRSSLFSIAANASYNRTVTADYNVVITSATEAMVIGRASVSAAGTTGEDSRHVSTTTVGQTFDTGSPVVLDVRATLSGVSNLTTHSLTLNYFRLNTLGIFSISTGGGGGGGPVTIPDLPFGTMVYCEWQGTTYPTRPAVAGGTFQRVTYFGPVEPNGVNSPGGPSGIDIWIDTSGA